MGPISPTLYRNMHALAEAEANAQPLNSDQVAVYRQARRGAARRQIAFDLSDHDMAVLCARAKGRCEMTAIPFSNERDAQLRFRPLRMSLDRFDNRYGYSLRNCRLVSAFANYMRGRASVDFTHEILLEYARHHGAIIPDRLIASRNENRWRY